MKQEQIEILKWWHGSRDYLQGVLLLSRFCKNKTLVKTLMKPGKENYGNSVAKLHYELAKSQGLNWREMPGLPDELEAVNEDVNSDVLTTDETDSLPEITLTDDLVSDNTEEVPDQYPKVIRRLKYEYSNLYTERSILHKEMREIPELNTLKNTFARADKLKAIKALSGKMEHLYGFLEDFEKSGVVPMEETIWPASTVPIIPELPKSIEELKKMKKNLQTDNTKDRNRLLYQQRTQGEKEQPIPAGPKRTKIELRIRKKEQEIIAIDNQILQLENADQIN